MAVYCQERVAAAQCVRVERLTVSGSKLLIVVYFRQKSSSCLQYCFSFEVLFVKMSIASVLSTVSSFSFVKMSVASVLSRVSSFTFVKMSVASVL
jgi:hypothetical protein